MKTNTWLEQIAPRLNMAWRGTWKVGTIEPARYLYDHELVVVTEGSCRIQIGETHHTLIAGTFLIISPNIYHATTTLPGGVRRLCFHFDWTRPAALPKRLPIWVYHPARPRATCIKPAPIFVPRQDGVRPFDLAGPLSLLMETIFHRWQTGTPHDRATSHAVLNELLIGLLWRKETGQRPADRATQLAYQVKELLDHAPRGTVEIQPLLATLGFSYEPLCRLFKKTFGLSPVRYRNAARLERARTLLRDPRRTVAEAAYEAGFDDPAYFSRKFRERHGVAPSHARD